MIEKSKALELIGQMQPLMFKAGVESAERECLLNANIQKLTAQLAEALDKIEESYFSTTVHLWENEVVKYIANYLIHNGLSKYWKNTDQVSSI